MRALLPVLVVIAACKPEPTGLPLLGAGAHTADAIELTEFPLDEIERPYDLAFHPDVEGLAYLVSPEDDGLVAASGLDAGEPGYERLDGMGADHFMAAPSALAFGDDGFFATVSETDEPTQQGTPADFMGPTLWTTDADDFEGGWASHYDMLHNSPNAVGIAWEVGNVYWVFDGEHESLTRYDFGDDHGGGGEDHSDGEIARYVEGEVGYVAGVPSHLVMDTAAQRLYVADTGNSRVAVLDTSTGEEGDRLRPDYDGADQYAVDGAEITSLITVTTIVLDEPSGIELHDGLVYVSDHATGLVSAYGLDGTLVDFVDTGLGAGLTGMAFDDAGALWITDAERDVMWRIRELPADE